MKRISRMLPVFLCMLLLCGCQTGPESSASLPTFSEETRGEGVLVRNVEELVAAIAPNTTITLPAGTLMVNDGSPVKSQNPYCRWEFDTLIISNVDGLTIQGSGKDLSVVKTDPRNATVLSFRNCRDLTLTGFTAGHTHRVEACEGNVVNLEGCSNVTISDLGLFGCGAVGLNGWMVRDLTISETDIYDCSVSGLSIYQGGGIRVENCRIFDLGADQAAMYVLNFSDCMDVSVENCRLEGNRSANLISCYASDVKVSGCTAKDNTTTDAVFRVSGQYSLDDAGVDGVLSIENASFEQTSGWKWLDAQCGGKLTDEAGREETEESMAERFGKFSRTMPDAAQGDPGSDRDQITVKNVDEFLAAIGPDREIVIDCPMLDLSTAKNYGRDGSDYYRWEDPFDGPQLTICYVENLTIRGQNGKDANVVSAVPRYAQVLAFDGCSNLTIRDLTAGHTREPGYCMGGVLQFQNCCNVTVENTGLFGCGTIGVDAQYNSNLLIRNNDIYECSYGGITLYCVDGASMEGNSFRALGEEYGDGFVYSTDSGSRNILFEQNLVQPGTELRTYDYPEYTK